MSINFKRYLITLLVVFLNFSFQSFAKPTEKRHSINLPSVNDASWQLIQSETEWQKRAGLQVVNHRGQFYLMGGRKPKFDPLFANDSELFGDVWVSSNKGSSWQKILDTDDQNHWPARAYFKAVSKGNYIYVIGGQNFTPVCVAPTPDGCLAYAPESEFFNDVWRSKDGKNWNKMTGSAPWTGRAGLMVEVLNGRIYVFGGSTNDDCAIIQGEDCSGPPSRIYYNDVWSSSNGKNWHKESDAPWAKRAGGATLVNNGYIYLLGGEFGFLPDQFGNFPYLNDVWRSRNGKDWQKITDAAQWSARPGHQCGVMYEKMVCFGGFGIPFNPTKVWVSNYGKQWQPLDAGAWGALYSEFDPSAGSEAIKYDFDIVEVRNKKTGEQSIYTFGGDREVFFLPPGIPGLPEPGTPEYQEYLALFNFGRVENDVWKFGF
ncbi:hypothetical protein AADZ86_17460 [Colwelliaceae bacterium BS250]